MLRPKVVVLIFALAFAALSLMGLEQADAQQSPEKKTATPSPTPPVDEEEGIVKIETEAVNVLFTAQDRNRRLLTNLKPEDVQVFENGQKQDVTAFSRQVDLPLSLAVLIDTSASQERTLPEEKSAAISFLESVIRPEKDEVAVVSFTGDSTLEQGMTNN